MGVTNNKSQILRSLLNSDNLEFLMEAHSGVSAVIAEEAGFKGIWASGLSMSAMTGCRDRNELDLSEICKIVEWMADHTKIPILVDGDTGGVDSNASRIMVNKLTKAGAAGVCIEDKMYPKHNSFLDNNESDLADPYRHAQKIKEMKRENPEFVVIARLESFISGQGVHEALRRALIYKNAGADAILVHSKRKDCSEIEKFMESWSTLKEEERVPIVIVPTKYYQTPTDHFRELGISTVIWANHQMRASIKYMKDICCRIHHDESLVGVENEIASVQDIFELQRDQELAALEKAQEERIPGGSSIILSATANHFKDINVPKCLVKIKGNTTVLDILETGLKSLGVSESTVVLGEAMSIHDLSLRHPLPTRIVYNQDWFSTSEVVSLHKALVERSKISNFPLYVSYGDIILKGSSLSKFSQNVKTSDIVIGVDPSYDPSNYNEFVQGSPSYSKLSVFDSFQVYSVSDSIPDNDCVGSFIGLFKVVTAKGLKCLERAVECVVSESSTARMYKVLDILCKTCKVSGVYITSSEWVDINTVNDHRKAEEMTDD